MNHSTAFKKTYTLSLNSFHCQIDMDRKEQSFTIFKAARVTNEYKRGQVLESLLSDTTKNLNLEQFFIYHLDNEENIDQRSLSIPAPSICRCFFVAEETVQLKFSQGLSALGLSENTGAGSLCGKCLPDLCRFFYQHKANWSFDQQKVRTKKTAPAEMIIFLGDKFPQITFENFFENCLYYKKGSAEISESEIRSAVWDKFKESIITVSL